MLAVIEAKRDELLRLCGRYRVRRLDVFGSAVRGGFDPARNDLDFLVEFLPLAPGAHADAYFGLAEALGTLFGRTVDLVETRAIRNPYFLKSVTRMRELVYAA